MDSRFRGNDGGLQVFVIPAKAGIQKLLAIYDLPQLIENLLFYEICTQKITLTKHALLGEEKEKWMKQEKKRSLKN